VKVVHRIITELAVIDVTPQGLVLREIAPGTTVEAVAAKTEARLVPDPAGVRTMPEGA
jgi:3-oxoacid CoA-transferase subunit B